MRCTLVVACLSLIAAGCGSGRSQDCEEDCPAGFACYYGVCIPDTDGGTDGRDATETADTADTTDTADGRDTLPEAVACTGPADCDDGNPCLQDLCDTTTGLCFHPRAPDGTPCPDEGDPATVDQCIAGACAHVPGPSCTTDWECEDGDPCTTDACREGRCVAETRPDCCRRDGDCMWPGHVWECDAATGTCYDPPRAEPCGNCSRRTDCGDGGEGSDDMCVYYGSSWSDPGCSKDCAGDADCPRAYACTLLSDEGGRACEPGDAGCLCLAAIGSCGPYATLGNGCMASEMCQYACNACRSMICLEGRCTFECGSDDDCP
jgi:hypothetical protein